MPRLINAMAKTLLPVLLAGGVGATIIPRSAGALPAPPPATATATYASSGSQAQWLKYTMLTWAAVPNATSYLITCTIFTQPSQGCSQSVSAPTTTFPLPFVIGGSPNFRVAANFPGSVSSAPTSFTFPALAQATPVFRAEFNIASTMTNKATRDASGSLALMLATFTSQPCTFWAHRATFTVTGSTYDPGRPVNTALALARANVLARIVKQATGQTATVSVLSNSLVGHDASETRHLNRSATLSINLNPTPPVQAFC
jgi:hypothetical protein